MNASNTKYPKETLTPIAQRLVIFFTKFLQIVVTIFINVLFYFEKYSSFKTLFLEITVFHQGTDGVSFDAIGIETEEYDVYNCIFPQPKFLDGDMWETTTECSGN